MKQFENERGEPLLVHMQDAGRSLRRCLSRSSKRQQPTRVGHIKKLVNMLLTVSI